MIFVYLLFCIIIGFINNKTNVIFALVLGIFGLDFLLNGNSIIDAMEALILIPKIIFQTPQTILLVVVIVLLFILSNLLNLINVDYLVDRKVGKYSNRKQQIITFFMTFFSTNMNLANSDIADHHREVYDLNSGITPFLNPISLIVIFISTIIIMFENVNGISEFEAGLIILINIPAIWWVFKTLVQLGANKLYVYKINEANMNLIRPSIEVAQTIKVQKSLDGKKFLKRTIQLLLPAFLIALFSPQYKIYYFIIIYLLLLIGYTINSGVKAVYKEKIMAEEEIYYTIKKSILGISPEIISFLLTIIFTSLSYDFLVRFYANNYSQSEVYFLALTALVIGMLFFKDYLVAISMAVPITLIGISANYAIDGQMIRTMYIAIISIATIIQILYIIDFKQLKVQNIIDLVILVFVTMTTLYILVSISVATALVFFITCCLAYVILFMRLIKREKNDNIRHT